LPNLYQRQNGEKLEGKGKDNFGKFFFILIFRFHPGPYDHVDKDEIIPSFIVPQINLEKDILPPLSFPKKRKNPLIEIISVSVGCDFACAFCKTRFARGKHQRYTRFKHFMCVFSEKKKKKKNY
jgi:hypothetical protein